MKEYVQKDVLWISIARETYKAQKMRKEYEAIEKELLKKLKAASDEQSSTGGGFRFECIERKGSIRYKDIDVLKTIDLEPYRGNDTVSWKLYKY